jgi:hypothetical protein
MSLLHVEASAVKPSSEPVHTGVDIDAVIQGTKISLRQHRRSEPNISVKYVQNVHQIVHAAISQDVTASTDIDRILAVNDAIPPEMATLGFSVQSVDAIGQDKPLKVDVDGVMQLGDKDEDEVQVLLRSPEFEANPATSFLHEQAMQKLHDNDIEKAIQVGEAYQGKCKMVVKTGNEMEAACIPEKHFEEDLSPGSPLVDIDDLLTPKRSPTATEKSSEVSDNYI